MAIWWYLMDLKIWSFTQEWFLRESSAMLFVAVRLRQLDGDGIAWGIGPLVGWEPCTVLGMDTRVCRNELVLALAPSGKHNETWWTLLFFFLGGIWAEFYCGSISSNSLFIPCKLSKSNSAVGSRQLPLLRPIWRRTFRSWAMCSSRCRSCPDGPVAPTCEANDWCFGG